MTISAKSLNYVLLIVVLALRCHSVDGGDSSSSASICGASSGSESGRRLGSGAPWYCEEWERDHLEATSSAAMMIIALIFENLHHHLHHLAEHSFVYGQVHAKRHAFHKKHERRGSRSGHQEHHGRKDHSVFKKPLRLVLFARMGGEFMVLGFLAFTIWTCNQQGLFDALAEMQQSSIRMPTVGSDYLHLMEEVHMQVFVAMLLYFSLALILVLGVDSRIREYEQNRSDWIEQLLEMSGTRTLAKDSRSLSRFKTMRAHFLDGCVSEILRWRTTSPDMFAELKKTMKIEKAEADIAIEDLREAFTNRFSFLSYVVFSLCSSTEEIICMSPYALFSILFAKGMLAVMHRFAHIPAEHITPFMSAFSLFLILGIVGITLFFEWRLEKPDQGKGLEWVPDLMDRWSRVVSPEAVVLTILQVLVFFVCHTWAGYMIKKDFWNAIIKDGKMGKLLTAILYILTLLFFAYTLPRCVPNFSAVMSMPPFFSQKNESIVQLVSVQVIDKQMVEAREKMNRMKKKNALKTDDPVRIMKETRLKGKSARVINPSWHGLVKVCLDEDDVKGKIKTYQAADLEIIEDKDDDEPMQRVFSLKVPVVTVTDAVETNLVEPLLQGSGTGLADRALKDTVGKYIVTHDIGIPVSKTEERGSPIIAHLARGTVVEVLEFAKESIEGRIRARIASPTGWISTRNVQGSHHFVEKSEAQDALVYTNKEPLAASVESTEADASANASRESSDAVKLEGRRMRKQKNASPKKLAKSAESTLKFGSFFVSGAYQSLGDQQQRNSASSTDTDASRFGSLRLSPAASPRQFGSLEAEKVTAFETRVPTPRVGTSALDGANDRQNRLDGSPRREENSPKCRGSVFAEVKDRKSPEVSDAGSPLVTKTGSRSKKWKKPSKSVGGSLLS